MFYKNYMTNYIGIGDTITIAIMDRDMTGFKNETKEDGEFILAHTKGFIDVSRKEYEKPYDYLENGLFKGLIPPKFILQEIEEHNEFQKNEKLNLLEKAQGRTLNVWNDEFFKKLKYDDNMDLCEVLDLLSFYNNRRVKKYNLEPWNIEKEYKDYLIKYWGDYKFD